MYGVCQGRRPHENDGASSRQRASHLKIKSSAIWSPSMVIDPNRPFNSETCLTELYRKRRETNLWRCVTDDGQKNRQEQKKNKKKHSKAGQGRKGKEKIERSSQKESETREGTLRKVPGMTPPTCWPDDSPFVLPYQLARWERILHLLFVLRDTG